MVLPCYSKDLVVQVRPEQGLFGVGQLQAHEQRQNATEEEKHKRRNNIALTNRLMVHMCKPPEKSARRLPGLLQEVMLVHLGCIHKVRVISHTVSFT
jgi:hypothetical protein